jgi:hypothetical protein
MISLKDPLLVLWEAINVDIEAGCFSDAPDVSKWILQKPKRLCAG